MYRCSYTNAKRQQRAYIPRKQGNSMICLAEDLTTASVTPSSTANGLSLLSPPYLTGTTSGATYLFHPKNKNLLVLELTVRAVDHNVSLLVNSVSEHHLLELGPLEIFCQELVHVVFLAPLDRVFQHGEGFFDLEVAGSEELEKDYVGSFVLEKWDAPDRNFFWLYRDSCLWKSDGDERFFDCFHAAKAFSIVTTSVVTGVAGLVSTGAEVTAFSSSFFVSVVTGAAGLVSTGAGFSSFLVSAVTGAAGLVSTGAGFSSFLVSVVTGAGLASSFFVSVTTGAAGLVSTGAGVSSFFVSVTTGAASFDSTGVGATGFSSFLISAAAGAAGLVSSGAGTADVSSFLVSTTVGAADFSSVMVSATSSVSSLFFSSTVSSFAGGAVNSCLFKASLTISLNSANAFFSASPSSLNDSVCAITFPVTISSTFSTVTSGSSTVTSVSVTVTGASFSDTTFSSLDSGAGAATDLSVVTGAETSLTGGTTGVSSFAGTGAVTFIWKEGYS
ncbi:hypothetical protein HID58_035015 [Brassica napus]|uniref:Uncharacterized protein n=1 Tax=Brassica napus TaxID=3708 RepID=A0ABQ8C3S7_BRANA|nr:hypothetical protein HID58_035015 [Brassica napus]